MHFQVKHSIELVPGSSFPNASIYKIPILKNEEICRQIQDLIEKGHICPISSPCGSPVVLVPKKNETWHMCIDYRALNKISVKNIYPLPRMDELINSLKSANLFTKLDLKSGYHRVHRCMENDFQDEGRIV